MDNLHICHENDSFRPQASFPLLSGGTRSTPYNSDRKVGRSREESGGKGRDSILPDKRWADIPSRRKGLGQRGEGFGR